MKKLYLTIALLALPAVCGATDWYVDDAGSSGDGSFENPWALSELVWGGAGIADGDLIYVMPGTYTTPGTAVAMFATSDNFPGSITIRAYDMSDKPVFNAAGQNRHCFYGDNIGTFTVDGILCMGDIDRAYNGLSVGSSTPVVKVYRSGFDTWGNVGVELYGNGGVFSESWVAHTANTGLIGVTLSNADIGYSSFSDAHTNSEIAIHNGIGSNILIHDSDITGPDFSTYPLAEGCIDVPDGVGVNYTDVTIQDVIMTDCGSFAMKVESPNGLTVRRTKTFGTNGYWLKLGEAAPTYPMTGLTVLDHNYIYGWSQGGEGIEALLSYSPNVKIYNNTFVPSPATTGATMRFSTTSDVVDGKNNIVQHVAGRVILIDAGTDMSNFDLDYTVYNSAAAKPFLILGTGYTLAEWNATFSQDANSQQTDPMLDTQGRPTAKSPSAVKGGGSLIDGGMTVGGLAYIGAYPYYEGVVTPWNIVLSIPGGPGRIGGGVVYNAPEYYMLMETGDSFLMETGDKIILE